MRITRNQHVAAVLSWIVLAISLAITNPVFGTDYNSSWRAVQFTVTPVLNARAVTTVSDGKLVTWNKGIDGTFSGLATRQAADLMGSKDKVALPDDGIFPATEFHPALRLRFSNNDAAGNQVRYSDRKVADAYSFDVPEGSYTNVSLIFMSAFGTSEISVELTYSDKTADQQKLSIEDWAAGITESDAKYFIASNLAKWGPKNTELEKDHHYVMGVNLKPAEGKKLVKIAIMKPASKTALTFWGAAGYTAGLAVSGSFPSDYKGTAFVDGFHKTGPANIPGIVQCALFDLGGEGVAYHDTTPENEGSDVLNRQTSPYNHQRAHASEYVWHFRAKEGVDISYVKDWADLNHPNAVAPPVNQFYIGWTSDGEWTNYTVNVKEPGTYAVKCLYTYFEKEVHRDANGKLIGQISFDVNGKPAAVCELPRGTPGWHYWDYGQIATINFAEPGLNLLTFHYRRGNNWAYFVFERIDK